MQESVCVCHKWDSDAWSSWSWSGLARLLEPNMTRASSTESAQVQQWHAMAKIRQTTSVPYIIVWFVKSVQMYGRYHSDLKPFVGILQVSWPYKPKSNGINCLYLYKSRMSLRSAAMTAMRPLVHFCLENHAEQSRTSFAKASLSCRFWITLSANANLKSCNRWSVAGWLHASWDRNIGSETSWLAETADTWKETFSLAFEPPGWYITCIHLYTYTYIYCIQLHHVPSYSICTSLGPCRKQLVNLKTIMAHRKHAKMVAAADVHS